MYTVLSTHSPFSVTLPLSPPSCSTDIDPEREAIWLHAYKYEGPGFAFQVLLPDFADGLTTFEIPSFLPTSKTQQGTDASASS